MENKKVLKKYEGLGFVELILSIAISGIALVVLLNMASNSMQEAIRYERHDALTRLAMDGALVVRKHSESANDMKTESLEFGSQRVDFSPTARSCYQIDFTDAVVDFTLEYPYLPPVEDNLEEISEQNYFHTQIVYDKENDFGDTYYVAYCVEDVEPSGPLLDLYIGKVVVGYVDCGECDLDPYVHNLIVSVKNQDED